MDGRAYRLLLLLLPRPLRTDFGADMEQLHADRLAEAVSEAARIRVRLNAVRDVVVEAARERVDQLMRVLHTIDWGEMMMMGWGHESKFAVRALWKRPGFTAAAVGTLSLGIAVTVSMFSVVHAVLLAPLPFPASDELVVLENRSTRNGALTSETVAHPDIRAIQEGVPGLTVAGYSGTNPTLIGFGDPQIIPGARVTDGLITLTGLQPVIGRDLTAADDDPGADRVAVVSYSFWQRHLEGSNDALGRSITLSGEPWEIVGVAPEGFDFPNGAELWVPRRHQADGGCGHGCRILRGVGRLDAPLDDVRAPLQRVSAQIATDFPDSNAETEFALQPMLEFQVAGVRTGVLALFGAVVMVLLIACANVANLLLVRAHGRRREVALRRTLGASRTRIIRELVAESALIAALAGLTGTGLAWWGTQALVRLAPDSLPRTEGIEMGGQALLFALGLVVVVTALFGVLPALKASRDVDVTRAGRRATDGRGGERSRSALLAIEFALSLSLLLGTGLLLRTMVEIRSVDLGFETENVERFRFSLPGARYDSLGIEPFISSVEAELTSIPGVRAVGWGFGVPLAAGNISASVQLLDRPAVAPNEQPEFAIRPSTPGLLEAAGMELVQGRWIEEGDRYGDAAVIVVNEAAVRTHYPDVDPIGRQITLDVTWSFENSPPRTIVGVVKDVIRSSPTEPPSPAVYVPNAQFGATSGYMTLALEPGVSTVIPQAREIVTRHDPGMAIWGDGTIEEAVIEARSDTTFYTMLITLFSAVALLLAAIGLYGAVSYSVSQRTREIGVRIALGAAGDQVIKMVVKEGIRPVIAGALLGVLLSILGSRLIASMLFGVGAQDPITLVGVTALLALVTMAATALPARRASRIAPATALEAE